MGRSILLLLLAPIVFIACSSPPPPEPEKEEPPPPTAGEIAGEFRTAMGTFSGFNQSGAVIPPERADQGVQQIQQIKQKHQAGENGPEGIRIAGDDVEKMLRTAFENEAWHMVMFTYRCLQVLDAEAAVNFVTFRNMAFIQVNRPQVTISGIYEDHEQGNTFLFCDVFFPPTRETVRWQAQKGDCWQQQFQEDVFEICVEELVGNTSARFRYTNTDETFVVTKKVGR